MEDEEPESAQGWFGDVHSNWSDWFGDVVGGHEWVYLPELQRNIGRERGFLSKSDRSLLVETHSLNLSDKTQRNARTRVRNRILSAYFDAQFLQFLSDRDRNLIFKNIRENQDGLNFREAFKEFVRFTYLGLLEDEHYIHVPEILEAAIKQAEEEHAIHKGQDVDVEVEINVKRNEGPDIERLERRYAAHGSLSIDELDALVNSDHFDDPSGTNAADIDLADAIYYDARQPGHNKYTNTNRDREKAEQIVTSLRSFFDEYGIETREELEQSVARLNSFDEEQCDELLDKFETLLKRAPPFAEQLQETSKLSERDSEFLYKILWPREDVGVEEAVEKQARPPLSEDGWDPAEEESLQKFAARVEAAREVGSVVARGGGDSSRERWEEVLSVIEFDEREWAGYMIEQKVEYCKSDLLQAIERQGVEASVVEEADSWSELSEHNPDQKQPFYELDSIYREYLLDPALERIQQTPEELDRLAGENEVSD
jgi:hypothetical protein